VKNCVTVILAGGRGNRLQPLTNECAKPAVQIGGAYRIIDFPLSNCLNSEFHRILLLTQFKGTSLDRHVDLAWRRFFRRELGEFLDVIPPEQRLDDHWYQGTADAVYQNVYHIEQHQPDQTMILAGDHVYRMDYRRLLDFHRSRQAALTIAALPVVLEQASRFGVMEVDDDDRVVNFLEKPAKPRPMRGDTTQCLASMGVYIFDTRTLFAALLRDATDSLSKHDFGRDIVPAMIGTRRVFAYPFCNENNEPNYWRDVGTLDSYFEANMDLLTAKPPFDFYDNSWPIQTFRPNLPPAKFLLSGGGQALTKRAAVGHVVNSAVCSGSIVSEGRLDTSVVGHNVTIHDQADIRNCILLDGVEVGSGCKIRRAILTEGVSLPANTQIGYDPASDAAAGYCVSESGIVVVTN
jgi:glucose-1-phosphate adenylyltransferase